MGVVDVDVRISSHLKEELVWAVDKRLRIISTIMLFKNSGSVYFTDWTMTCGLD